MAPARQHRDRPHHREAEHQKGAGDPLSRAGIAARVLVVSCSHSDEAERRSKEQLFAFDADGDGEITKFEFVRRKLAMTLHFYVVALALNLPHGASRMLILTKVTDEDTIARLERRFLDLHRNVGG